MKRILLIWLLLITGSFCYAQRSWNECSDSLVVAYKKGMLAPSDDSKTFALLDRLTRRTTPEQKEYNFILFNEIVTSADGALAEVLGEYCIRWVRNDCTFVLAYLKDNPDMEERYISYIAYEFLSEDDLFPTFKKDVLGNYNGEDTRYVRGFLKKLDKKVETLRDIICTY